MLTLQKDGKRTPHPCQLSLRHRWGCCGWCMPTYIDTDRHTDRDTHGQRQKHTDTAQTANNNSSGPTCFLSLMSSRGTPFKFGSPLQHLFYIWKYFIWRGGGLRIPHVQNSASGISIFGGGRGDLTPCAYSAGPSLGPGLAQPGVPREV